LVRVSVAHVGVEPQVLSQSHKGNRPTGGYLLQGGHKDRPGNINL